MATIKAALPKPIFRLADSSSKKPISSKTDLALNFSSPNNPDIRWLQERTTGPAY
jgi:hypothetical protein